MLKVEPIDDDESLEAAEALQFWGGDGAVRLLRQDRERRVLLMERASPGVLAHGDRYVAIDPKPMLGEREFDVPSFLWNPLGSTMRLDVTERRLRAFAAVGLDEERMRAWALIRGAYLRRDPNELRVLRALI